MEVEKDAGTGCINVGLLSIWREDSSCVKTLARLAIPNTYYTQNKHIWALL